MNAESIALTLDGYLHSLRRLSGNRCDFWSYIIGSSEDVEADLREHLSTTNSGAVVVGKVAVGYTELDTLLNQHALSKLVVRDKDVLGLFAWDIVEYIQMSYRDDDSPTDPFASRSAMVFNAVSDFHGEHLYLAVPLTDRALIVGFGTRA